MRAWFRWAGRPGGGPLNCHQVSELLQSFLDGEIDAVRADRIAAHLDDCRRCGLEAETYEHIKSSLAARRPEVPDESVERLRAFGMRLVHGEEPSVT